MRTQVLAATQSGAIERAAVQLRAGALVAFPTDTVYGLGAHLSHPDSIAQIYVVKDRPVEKAIPVLLADLADLKIVAERVPPAAEVLARTFWPGGLTLIVPRRAELPPDLSSGPGVAVRIPNHPVTLALIRAAGAPLATTSANLSGRPSLDTAQAVLDEMGGRIPLILDGGRCPGGVPSTVVDCTTPLPRVLRVGAISKDSLRQVMQVEE